MIRKSRYLYIYFSNKFILSNNKPVPSATHVSGLSATNTGTFSSCDNNLSNPSISAPPPVITIPLSIISADNSGGVCSSTLLAS